MTIIGIECSWLYIMAVMAMDLSGSWEDRIDRSSEIYHALVQKIVGDIIGLR